MATRQQGSVPDGRSLDVASDPQGSGDGRNGGPNGSSPTRIAAIDIGSDSIRQIIADVSAGSVIRVVDEMKAAPRLGAGLEKSGELSAEGMMRAIESLTRMATLARQMGASRLEAVATSAVRDASNAAVPRRSRLTQGRQSAALGGSGHDS